MDLPSQAKAAELPTKRVKPSCQCKPGGELPVADRELSSMRIERRPAQHQLPGRTRKSIRRRPNSNSDRVAAQCAEQRGAAAISADRRKRVVRQERQKTCKDPVISGKSRIAESVPGSAQRRAQLGGERASHKNNPPKLSRNYFWNLDDSPTDNESLAPDDDASARTSSFDSRSTYAASPLREKPSLVRGPDHAGYAWAPPLSKSEEAEFFDSVCPPVAPPAERRVASKSKRRHLRRQRVKAAHSLNAAARPFVPPGSTSGVQNVQAGPCPAQSAPGGGRRLNGILTSFVTGQQPTQSS